MRWFQRKVYKSDSVNIFHTCVHKTGSQWIRKILSDKRTYHYSGLRHYAYQNNFPEKYDPRKLTERSFLEPFPEKTIISPLYIDYKNYRNIPKPDSTRGFFVQRDPRDILVSYYYSMKYSHSSMGEVEKRRLILNQSTLEDGIKYTLQLMSKTGLLDTLHSWSNTRMNDPAIMVVRYEDLVGAEQFELFRHIFKHLDIPIPERTMKGLLADYSFKKLSGGRNVGDENIASHYRKGVEGGWKKVLHGEIYDEVRQVMGDLVGSIGYSW